ncbi:gamma-glutamyltransferase family protein [Oceanimonas baumannii]|uniref:gamma-glutamyltransferase family protein n=1 Tax=Oceanimonas baumannii TaxID=129578 RepID=UPI003A91404A
MPLLLLILLWLPVAHADNRAIPGTTGWQDKPLVRAGQAMVVTANPHASQAAQRILTNGGSAVDAMIAAQMVLALVEPQSSGLGGGSFLVYWQQDKQEITTLDGRETAPLSVPATWFLNGQELSLEQTGERSVGTPGTVMLMWQAHQRFGRLPWRELFVPAIQFALNGVEVSPRLARLIARHSNSLKQDPQARQLFFDDRGASLPAGYRLQNPLLAAILTRLSIEGPTAFYQGKIAELIVEKVAQSPQPGLLSLYDLARYRVQERPALCAPYRQYRICGMGPPGSSALALGQILGTLSHFELSKMGPTSPDAWRLIADASRLAFADHHHHNITDGDVETIAERLHADHLGEWAGLLKESNKAQPALITGQPEPPSSEMFPTLASSTQISIIDASGNAVSLTSSLESIFGSRLMVQGFMLNNSVSRLPFAPGKRPHSFMSPTLVFDQQGELLLLAGSSGGSRTVGYVLHSLISILDWGMDIREALHQPHVLHRDSALEMEPSPLNTALQPAMATLGFTTRFTELDSGLHVIMRQADGLAGVADPRQEGTALAVTVVPEKSSAESDRKP